MEDMFIRMNGVKGKVKKSLHSFLVFIQTPVCVKVKLSGLF